MNMKLRKQIIDTYDYKSPFVSTDICNGRLPVCQLLEKLTFVATFSGWKSYFSGDLVCGK